MSKPDPAMHRVIRLNGKVVDVDDVTEPRAAGDGPRYAHWPREMIEMAVENFQAMQDQVAIMEEAAGYADREAIKAGMTHDEAVAILATWQRWKALAECLRDAYETGLMFAIQTAGRPAADLASPKDLCAGASYTACGLQHGDFLYIAEPVEDGNEAHLVVVDAGAIVDVREVGPAD